MINPELPEARETGGLFSLYGLKSMWEGTIDLLFPPRCQHCNRVDTRFCEICADDLLQLPVDVIKSEMLPLSGIISTGYHEDLLQSAVQALKYSGQRELGTIFAKRLATILEQENWQFDTIIPVPMYTAKLKKRGYNQAKEISIHLASLFNRQHGDEFLIRESQIQSQVGLNFEERIENVKGAFRVTSTLEGAIVLLVDDVKTTGATMASCAEVLLENGAKEVYGITVTAAGHFQ